MSLLHAVATDCHDVVEDRFEGTRIVREAAQEQPADGVAEARKQAGPGAAAVDDAAALERVVCGEPVTQCAANTADVLGGGGLGRPDGLLRFVRRHDRAEAAIAGGDVKGGVDLGNAPGARLGNAGSLRLADTQDRGQVRLAEGLIQSVIRHLGSVSRIF